MGPTKDFREMFEVRRWNFEVWVRSLARKKIKKDKIKKRVKNSERDSVERGCRGEGREETLNIEVWVASSIFEVGTLKSGIEVWRGRKMKKKWKSKKH